MITPFRLVTEYQGWKFYTPSDSEFSNEYLAPLIHKAVDEQTMCSTALHHEPIIAVRGDQVWRVFE